MKKPNIVCIMTDDTHFRNIGCYGGDVPTPHLDSIAEDGIKFTNFYCSASVCTPSRFTYITGQYASRCSHPKFVGTNPVTEPSSVTWNVSADENHPSIGRILSSAGYRTGFFGKWHAFRPKQDIGYPEFDIEEDPANPETAKKLSDYQQILQNEIKTTLGFDECGAIHFGNCEANPVESLRYHNLDWITGESIDFLDRHHDKPFFLYTALTAYHGPEHDTSLEQDPKCTIQGILEKAPNVPFTRQDLKDLIKERGLEFNHHTAGMTWIDECIGAIKNKLKEYNLLDDTVFIFATDHNTEPGKGSCYNTGIHIPFLISWPKEFEKGKVCSHPSQNIDFLPTLADIACAELPADKKLDGTSLLPVMKGEDENPYRPLYFEFGYSRALVKGDYKYLMTRFPDRITEELKSGERDIAPNLMDMKFNAQARIVAAHYPHSAYPEQLYNIKKDYEEKNDLIDEAALDDIKKDLKKELLGIAAGLPHPLPEKADEYYYSDEYTEKCSKTAKVSLNDIPWWPKEQVT
jgi:arylsulfatase A-like enzyme